VFIKKIKKKSIKNFWIT